MKKYRLILVTVIVGLTMFSTSCGGTSEKEKAVNSEQSAKKGKEYTSAYVCPMHCEGSGSDEEGSCPVCGMDYVKNEDVSGK